MTTFLLTWYGSLSKWVIQRDWSHDVADPDLPSDPVDYRYVYLTKAGIFPCINIFPDEFLAPSVSCGKHTVGESTINRMCWCSTETNWTGCQLTNSFGTCTSSEFLMTFQYWVRRALVFCCSFYQVRSGRMESPKSSVKEFRFCQYVPQPYERHNVAWHKSIWLPCRY